MPKITFYPVGNADTFVIDLARGQKIIFDYADRRSRSGEGNASIACLSVAISAARSPLSNARLP